MRDYSRSKIIFHSFVWNLEFLSGKENVSSVYLKYRYFMRPKCKSNSHIRIKFCDLFSRFVAVSISHHSVIFIVTMSVFYNVLYNKYIIIGYNKVILLLGSFSGWKNSNAYKHSRQFYNTKY